VGNDPELEAEQAYVDRAYERLDQLRSDTEARLRSVLDQGRGGTHQFREERDVIVRTSLARLDQLDIGDQALCFGRIDRRDQAGRGEVESFHIGRLGVSAEDLEPLVVDWRAPVAEPFYRATGRDPMGLVLRRHLASEGRRLVGLEDERFAAWRGDGGGAGSPGAAGPAPPGAGGGDGAGSALVEGLELGGPGALLAAVEGPRTGHMRDIVATIQREQDEIIRSPLAGVLVVQGGPGTGKTAVALHRAAYLLYTHRFPLERQGVLVIGPNPLFMRYIEHVLPSLGESGVTLSTVTGLVHGIAPRAEEPAALAELKGDPRMAEVLARAVRSRQRPLRRTVEIPFGTGVLRLRPEASKEVVERARRRPGPHNARRRFVEQLVVRHLAEEHLRALGRRGIGPGRLEGAGAPGRRNGSGGAGGAAGGAGEDDPSFDLAEFASQLRRQPEFVEALDRMWPRLSGEELLHDLFGSPPLLRLAATGVLSDEEQAMLVRPRSRSLAEVPFTPADVALVDEARLLLGPRRARRDRPPSEADEARTYGHIVIDEAQDLSPMQLRMVARRSLSGSITVVGDVAQATGPWAPRSWDDVTAHLPASRPPRLVELTVSYRTPAEVLEVAARVLRAAVPGMEPPTAVRRTGMAPRLVEAPEGALGATVAAVAGEMVDQTAPGTVAVLCPASLVGELSVSLDRAGSPAADPRVGGLGGPLSLLPVDLANGLEFDAVVVVEPAAVVEESPQAMRTLYVALTRPTRHLAVVHQRPLPEPLRP
jgi:DNA helicase IV